MLLRPPSLKLLANRDPCVRFGVLQVLAFFHFFTIYIQPPRRILCALVASFNRPSGSSYFDRHDIRWAYSK